MKTSEERYRKVYPVTWEQLHQDCRALAWRLLDIGKWSRIVAIARGGLVPAAIVARELDIHFVDTVCVSSYTIRIQGKTRILKDIAGGEKDWLIVDDLVDTGGTARIVREMLPKSHFATFYAKPDFIPEVDTFITEVSQDTWILFPWDSQPQYEYIQPIVSIKTDDDQVRSSR